MSQENIDRHILPPAADIVGQRSGINEMTDKYDKYDKYDQGDQNDLDEVRRQKALLVNGALQNAIFNSANFSSIATDAQGIIQIFNAGAERMLGYTAAEVMNRMRPSDISDQQELIARATDLSVGLPTPLTPGFATLVFKASNGIEDIYEQTFIRKDGSRLPAVVSVTALRDDKEIIIGYLLVVTSNVARKLIEEEQKKLGQRLRDQQFYTRALIESNIDARMIIDRLGSITDVNQQMETLTACTRDELIGAPFKQYFTDPERAEAGIKLALNNKKVTHYELSVRDRAGKETLVFLNASSFYDRDRKLQGVFAVVRDITERKQIEAARWKAQNLLQKIASRLPGVVYQYRLRTDGTSCFPFASEALREIYRVSPEEAIDDASKVFACLHPDDHDGVVASIHKSAEYLTPWQHEYRVKFADGTQRWLFGNALPSPEADGSTLWHGFITDVTERKRTGAKLVESESRLKALIHAIPDLVWLKDTEGVYLACNHRFERFFGASENEIVGKTDYDFVDRKLAAFFRKNDQEAINKAMPSVNEEWIVFADDGHREFLETTKIPIFDAEQRLMGVLGIGHDITEHKLVELEQNRQHLEQRVCSCTAELAQAKDAVETTATAGALRPEAKESP